MIHLVIPCYHAKDTLPRALDSLVAQTQKKFIVTLSIDGDGEDYSEIVEEYRRRGLFLRVLERKENGGPGVARQAAIDSDDMCEYLMFLDADDMLMPRAVEVLGYEIQKNCADVVMGGIIAEQNNAPVFFMNPNRDSMITWCHAKIYRTKFLRDNNIRFDPKLRLNEDSMFNLVVFNSTDKKMTITEPLYLWRYQPNSLTRYFTSDKPTFFHKGWKDYVYGQIEGLKAISQIRSEISPQVVAATLLNIYYHFETSKFYKMENEDVIGWLNTLRDDPLIQAVINDQDFWTYVAQNLKACDFEEDNLIFYKDRFVDWLKYVEVEK